MLRTTARSSASTSSDRTASDRTADQQTAGRPSAADRTSGGAWRPRHLPQLDGLRTVAVTLVLAYHVLRQEDLPGLAGAFVGVDVFFVLSGFLITSLLLREHADTGRVDLRRFYLRRLWRLYPALVLVSAVAAAAFAWAPPSFGLSDGSPVESLVALFYGMSWWSGLELPGGPYLLGLTWSLSVEEHFYLLWPLVLLVLLRRGGGVRAVAVVTVLANAWPAALYLTGADTDRLYFMPDARFAQLLTGCLLAALLQRPETLARLRPLVGAVPTAVAGGWLAIVVLVADRHQGWYWLAGLQLSGIAAAVVVGHLALHGRSWLAQGLGWRPLALLGVWSYGIYLWHLPLMRLAPPVFGDTALVTVLACLASIPVAAASYRYVEQPLLRRSARRPAPVRQPAPLTQPVPLRQHGPVTARTGLTSLPVSAGVRPAEVFARSAA